MFSIIYVHACNLSRSFSLCKYVTHIHVYTCIYMYITCIYMYLEMSLCQDDTCCNVSLPDAANSHGSGQGGGGGLLRYGVYPLLPREGEEGE